MTFGEPFLGGRDSLGSRSRSLFGKPRPCYMPMRDRIACKAISGSYFRHWNELPDVLQRWCLYCALFQRWSKNSYTPFSVGTCHRARNSHICLCYIVYCMYVYMCVYLHVCVCIYIYIYVYLYLYTHTCNVCIYIYICIYSYIHSIHVHTPLPGEAEAALRAAAQAARDGRPGGWRGQGGRAESD